MGQTRGHTRSRSPNQKTGDGRQENPPTRTSRAAGWDRARECPRYPPARQVPVLAGPPSSEKGRGCGRLTAWGFQVERRLDDLVAQYQRELRDHPVR